MSSPAQPSQSLLAQQVCRSVGTYTHPRLAQATALLAGHNCTLAMPPRVCAPTGRPAGAPFCLGVDIVAPTLLDIHPRTWYPAQPRCPLVHLFVWVLTLLPPLCLISTHGRGTRLSHAARWCTFLFGC